MKEFKSALTKKQKVTIFEDPIEETKIEGEATLIHIIHIVQLNKDYQLERWIVKFPNENTTYYRLIKTKIPQQRKEQEGIKL